MPNIAEILRTASQTLGESRISNPRREAASLLALALAKDQTFLIAHDDYRLSDTEEKRFENFLGRRAAHEPLQYIRGTQEFFGLDFIVESDVLIPRPETELIVENALEISKGEELSRFCEIGVGSGCISVSLLHNLKNASAIGLDVSEKALKIARINAEKHLVAKRLDLKISDVFDHLQHQVFDLIVSNPPYIPNGEIKNLQPEVRDFEPLSALTDGGNGLSIIEKIIFEAPRFLRAGGHLLMEIGFDQSQKVFAMFDKSIWQSVEFAADLQNIPRMVRARLGSPAPPVPPGKS